MSEAPLTFGTGEVAQCLGVSEVTARKYADALEAATGTALPRMKRARVFTVEQIDALNSAKQLADSDASLTVEGAVRRALGLDVQLVEPEEAQSRTGLAEFGQPNATELLERLAGLLESQGEELRALRAEVAELRIERALPATLAAQTREPRPRPWWRRMLKR